MTLKLRSNLFYPKGFNVPIVHTFEQDGEDWVKMTKADFEHLLEIASEEDYES